MKYMIGAVQERIGADQEETKTQNIKRVQERIDAGQADMEQRMVVRYKELSENS